MKLFLPLGVTLSCIFMMYGFQGFESHVMGILAIQAILLAAIYMEVHK